MQKDSDREVVIDLANLPPPIVEVSPGVLFICILCRGVNHVVTYVSHAEGCPWLRATRLHPHNGWK